MEYRPVVPAGVMPTHGLHQDYHAVIPDLSPPRSQGSSTGGASSIGDYAPRMYTPPTPPTPHEDEKVKDAREYRTYFPMIRAATRVAEGFVKASREERCFRSRGEFDTIILLPFLCFPFFFFFSFLFEKIDANVISSTLTLILACS